MSSFKKKKQPLLEDVSAWLFICSDMVEHVHVQNFVQSHDNLKDYRIDYANYWPAKYERLRDYSFNKSKAKGKMYFTFLQSEISNSIHTPIPTYCASYTDVLKYNELKYMIHNS